MDLKGAFNALGGGNRSNVANNTLNNVTRNVRLGNVPLNGVLNDARRGNLGGLINRGAREIGRRQQQAAREEQMADNRFQSAQRNYDNAERSFERDAMRNGGNDAYMNVQQQRFEQAQQRYIDAHVERFGEAPQNLRSSHEIRSQYNPNYAPSGVGVSQSQPTGIEQARRTIEGGNNPPRTEQQQQPTGIEQARRTIESAGGGGSPRTEQQQPAATERTRSTLEEARTRREATRQNNQERDEVSATSREPEHVDEQASIPQNTGNEINNLNPQDAMVLQAGLTLSGIDAGPVDGDPQDMTERGVREYIAQNPDKNLSMNDPQGVIDALREDMRNDPDMQTRMTSIALDGMDADVNDAKALQVALNDVDNAGLLVDGKIGPNSTQAFAAHMSNSYDSASGPDQMIVDNNKPAEVNQDQQTFDQGTFKPMTPGGGSFA